KPPRRVRFELSRLRALDGAGAALLLELCAELRARGTQVEQRGAEGRVRDILELIATSPAGEAPRAGGGKLGVVEQVGRESLQIASLSLQVLDFTGQTVVAAWRAVRDPRSVPWASVARVIERTGADALPIVGLITFLVGL